MEAVLDVLSWITIIIGSAFSVIGAIGLIRMPDVYTRIHAASLIETMGVTMILLGLAFQAGISLITAKLVIIFALLMFTNPTTTHALARALYHAGVRPVTGHTVEKTVNSGMASDVNSDKESGSSIA